MKHSIFVILFFLLLPSCSRQPSLSNSHVISVQSHALAQSLFYSGTVQPLKTIVIPSPAEGVVVDMSFQYGELIKSGQLLFLLSSSKFVTDYKAALMQYIKAKSEFNNSQTQLAEAQFLHKNQLISDDEYKTKKANFYGNQLALLQAKDVLDTLSKQLNINNIDLYKLTIADIDKITKAMHLQMNYDNLRIIAPTSGVLLSPNKSEEETKKITKGDIVKQGDVLAIIGDMSGISVQVKVNELTVNQLDVGQPVKVTGIAFPDDILEGKIERIDRQGEVSNGSLPTFAVKVIVPHLTPEQQKIIHVGMSAKVEIDIEEQAKMTIPLNALTEKDGVSYVKFYDEKKQLTREVAIKTGKTTLDSVTVLSGLKLGDKIIVPD